MKFKFAKSKASSSLISRISSKLPKQRNHRIALGFIFIFGLIGTGVLIRSFAASNQTQPETWATSGNVTVTPAQTNSPGYLQFNAPVMSSMVASSEYILIKKSALLAKPNTGPGWEFLKKQADATWDSPSLSDLNSRTQTQVLAAALVYARNSDRIYKEKVIAAIKKVCGTENTDGAVLPFARTLFGYVNAADLVDMPLSTRCNNGQTWQQFLGEARFKQFKGNTRWLTLDVTRGDSSSNWNAYSLSTHLAISIALNDYKAIEENKNIYRRFLGDTSSPWPKFNPTSGYRYNENGKSIDLLPENQVGINPDIVGDERSGAIINDAIRTYPGPAASISWDKITLGQSSIKSGGLTNEGKAYTEESLDALLAINMTLKAQGIDYTNNQNKALKRAFEFLIKNGGMSSYDDAKYLPLAINKMYGTGFDTKGGDSFGRHVGFGNWLF